MVHYEEDLTVSGTTTYTSGGIVFYVQKSVQIQLFDMIQAKAASGSLTISGTIPVWAEVQGSESGQAFRAKAYQQSGVSGLLPEIAPGSTELQNLPVHVSYEGT